MRITNKYGLPQAFVKMAESDYEYRPKRYSVTSILKGVRETILERRHHNEIEVDVSDMVWALFGTAVHEILASQQEKPHELKEEYLKIPVGDYSLTGRLDLYNEHTKTITDYKTCSTWKVIYGDYADWRKQLLVYAYMLQEIGFEVTNGEIIAFLKDHSKSQAKRKADYPDLPVRKITFRFGPEDYAWADEWIHERFRLIAECELLPDDELPLCSDEERWYSGDTYAVMKKGRKTALRVLDTLGDAEAWADDKECYIEYRPGEDRKCMDYCRAAPFCNYYLEKYTMH